MHSRKGASDRLKYKQYLKRDSVKKYFPLPNGIFCLGLSAGEIAVYAYLMYCEDRKTFQCYPSFRTIGKALKMSRNTVSKYIKLLEEKQLIRTESTEIYTANSVKRNGNLLYTILPIEQAMMRYYTQQLERAKLLQAQSKAG